MKLWKSKKSIGCVPGKSSGSNSLKQQEQELIVATTNTNTSTTATSNNKTQDTNNIAPLNSLNVDRAMSPAQSEDSGLAPERGTTYATITLPRSALNVAITLAERNDLSYPPVIGAVNPIGHAADFLAPGDRLHQIDGISTIGLSNQKIMNLLCANGGDSGPIIVEIEYSLPEYTVSQNSLCVSTKLAQITVEREGGCLGLTLRGGADYPLIVTHVRPHGPVYKTGRIKPGDRLLRVDNISLIGKTLAEAQQIIKCGGHISGYTNLTIEYDVSVVQSVEFNIGPLLIEIERPMNDKLGLVLCNYMSSNGTVSASTSMTMTMPMSITMSSTMPMPIAMTMTEKGNDRDEGTPTGIYIASILPASIADRCGALSVGDQVLSIDDTLIEHTAHSPDEVMTMLDTATGRGYTQMQIMPAHALARRGHHHNTLGSPKYSYSTLESRKSTTNRQRQRFIRKSSLPLESSSSTSIVMVGSNNPTANGPGTGTGTGTGGSGSGTGSGNGMTHSPSIGLCRAESFPVLLDCSQGAGIVLGSMTSSGVYISQILNDSVADRSGCIQPGDRIVAINKLYNLDVQGMRQLLDCSSGGGGGGGSSNNNNSHSHNGTKTPANWLELEIEFDMPDAVVPSSGVFNVKLLHAGKSGLGLSVSGGGGGGATNGHAGLLISDVKMGSPAHRSGSLRAGDLLLAVDNHPVQPFNVDALLKDAFTQDGCTTLTIKRVMLPDFLQPNPSPIYSNCPTTTTTPPPPPPLPLSSNVAQQVTGTHPHHHHHNQQHHHQHQHHDRDHDYDLYGKYNDCISLKSTTPQPDYFRDDHHHHHQHQQHQQQQQQHLFGDYIAGYELNRYASVDCTALPPPMENKVYGSAASSSSKSSSGGSSLHQIIFTVRLEPKGGLLGITLAGSEDVTKPITISGLVEGGIAYKNGQIQMGDQLLAIDEHSVQGIPLSRATGLLQQLGDIVHLKILRTHDLADLAIASTTLPQAQAIYAKVQRRPRSPSSSGHGKDVSDVPPTLNGNGNMGTGNNGSNAAIFPVTLYKDKVYDDYGFSVSDGLYERGVFINRIRSGGPADMCGLLKPFDRIMQVNEMKTQDFDCCLTVPLIAAAGDKIEMIIQRTE